MMIVKMMVMIAMMGEILQILSDNDDDHVDYDYNKMILMMVVMMMAMILIVRMMMMIIII